MKNCSVVLTLLALVAATSCTQERADVGRLVENYALVTIPAPDLTGITDNGKEVLKLYRKAADEVDKIYWQQYFGDGEAFLGSLTDPSEKLYAGINYGPWDRIDGKPFLPGYGARPEGACFYPSDMTAEEFDAWGDPDKKSPYTLVQRAADGSLKTVWYHDAYADVLANVEGYLNRAADVTIKESVRHYLLEMIKGLKTDDYYDSYKAWLEDGRQQDGPCHRPHRGGGRRPLRHEGLLRGVCAPEEPPADRRTQRHLRPHARVAADAARRRGRPRFHAGCAFRHLLLQRTVLQRLYQRRLQGNRHQLPL